jgi:ABC-type bacteriocin/lantibiotic exporter with double-glycine peptidase domain
MVLKSFWQLIRPYWRWVIVIFVALAIQTAFRVAVPVGFQLIFDRAIAFNDLAFLRDLLIFFLLFWLVQVRCQRTARLLFSQKRSLGGQSFAPQNVSKVGVVVPR